MWPPPRASRRRSRRTPRSRSGSPSASSISAATSTSTPSSPWSCSRRACSCAARTRVRERARWPSAARRASPAVRTMASWNVLATSLEGRRDALLIALRRLGKFRRGGYRNVVVGQVDDVPAFLVAVRDALASDPLLPTALAKVVPVETTIRFDATNAVDAFAAAAEPLLDRL